MCVLIVSDIFQEAERIRKRVWKAKFWFEQISQRLFANIHMDNSVGGEWFEININAAFVYINKWQWDNGSLYFILMFTRNIMALFSHRLASISPHVNRPSESWDIPNSNLTSKHSRIISWVWTKRKVRQVSDWCASWCELLQNFKVMVEVEGQDHIIDYVSLRCTSDHHYYFPRLILPLSQISQVEHRRFLAW